MFCLQSKPFCFLANVVNGLYALIRLACGVFYSLVIFLMAANILSASLRCFEFGYSVMKL